ncbi:MAG: flagellar biosynthesis protein FlhF [Deltaproteobacteria bacterium]|nr:MAG: flagellar biosynthesis protein FlhF [Deltaproteobacteria bacterium]
MNIKRFVARNTQEALRMVKEEMGTEAVILRTRTIHPGEGKSGQAGETIEVTAAVDYDSTTNSPRKGGDTGARALIERYENLEAQIREIRDLLWSIEAGAVLQPDTIFDPQVRGQYGYFKDFGIKGEIIRSLLRKMMPADPGDSAQQGQDALKQSLINILKNINMGGEVAGGQDQAIHAFIGPTGVGKTTTLAKLAARTALEQGKKVALITLDTFRIAAVNQLETYARIMGIPMEVASTRSELRKAIARHADCDHLFVDTVGRSPRDTKEIGQLMDLLKVSKKIRGYLVLSATTDLSQLLLAETKFRALAYESYIFTKLDEVEDASSMVNFLLCQSRPVAYFTTGQQVPEDVEPASKKKLAKLILNGRGGTVMSMGNGVH